MSIVSKGTVGLDLSKLGPNASKPVERGQMPKFGKVAMAIQFGKGEISDHERAFLIKKSVMFDNDGDRPLFLIECTAKQAKQHIKRFGSQLRVISVLDANKDTPICLYEKARSGIEEAFCKTWMHELFQTQGWYVNEETA